MNLRIKNSQFTITIFVSMFLLIALSYGDTADDKIQNVNLMIGTQKVLKIPGPKVSRLDIGDSDILKSKMSGDNMIILTALKKGITSVSIWQKESESLDYIVTTWKILPENIKEMIKDIPGVELMRTGSKITLIGALLTQKDEQRISKIAEVFSDDVDNLTYYNSQQSKQEAIKHILKAIGNPEVTAHFAGDNVVLKGIVYSEEDKERAGTVANAYIGEKGSVNNAIIIIDLPVEIDVTFVQLTPTSGSEIGADAGNLGIFQGPSLELNPKVNTGDTIGSSLQVGSIGYGLLNQRLVYLESKGLAKTIDKPHISTISGKPGRIQYGGQRGIKTTGEVGGDVTFVDFGLILEVLPVVGPDNMITIEMKLEVSQPITEPGAEGDFELQKFDTSTFGNVKVGETLVVSGLKQVVRQNNRSNVPFIGNVPILELLFANETKSDEQTDIAVFLTPQLPTKRNTYEAPYSEDDFDTKRKTEDPNMELK